MQSFTVISMVTVVSRGLKLCKNGRKLTSTFLCLHHRGTYFQRVLISMIKVNHTRVYTNVYNELLLSTTHSLLALVSCWVPCQYNSSWCSKGWDCNSVSPESPSSYSVWDSHHQRLPEDHLFRDPRWCSTNDFPNDCSRFYALSSSMETEKLEFHQLLIQINRAFCQW